MIHLFPEILLLFVIPTCTIYLFFRILWIKKYPFKIRTEILRISFLTYLVFLIYFVWLYSTFHLSAVSINLIPFKTISDYITNMVMGNLPAYVIANNLVGNILITLPFGVYLALKHLQIKRKTLFSLSILIPLIIELGQLLLHIVGFSTRTIDIDDVILNSLGILLGYYSIYYFLQIKSVITLK